ncbi:MAG: O-antigen ligase family protein [Gammaproteobacteria bacterium]|nr:O-antigen ligase family protein [Gammaproteobacteria bacterium]
MDVPAPAGRGPPPHRTANALHLAMPRLADTRAATVIGRTGLYLFALSVWLSTAGAYVGLGLMLCAGIASRGFRDGLRRDPMVLLAAAFAGFTLLYALWAAHTTSESHAMLWDDTWKWLRLFLFFILVAWWLTGDDRRVGAVLLLSLAGLLVKILLGIQAAGPSALWSGARIGFGLPVNSVGLFCATALLGLLVLAPRAWRSSGQRGRRGAIVRFIAWGCALILVLQAFITVQSRDAWIATLIVFPPVFALGLAASLRRNPGAPWLRLGASLGLAAVLIGTVTIRNLDTITERIQAEHSSWRALLAGDFENVPDGSIGYRVQLIEFGLQKWMQRPLFGWGPHSYRTLIEQADDAELRKLPHLHNAYVETLLTFGLAGALFFLGLMGGLCATLVRAWRSGRLATDYALFLSGALGLQLIWCLASFGINQVTWNFYFAMLAGTIYSYRMRLTDGQSDGNPGRV